MKKQYNTKLEGLHATFMYKRIHEMLIPKKSKRVLNPGSSYFKSNKELAKFITEKSGTIYNSSTLSNNQRLLKNLKESGITKDNAKESDWSILKEKYGSGFGAPPQYRFFVDLLISLRSEPHLHEIIGKIITDYKEYDFTYLLEDEEVEYKTSQAKAVKISKGMDAVETMANILMAKQHEIEVTDEELREARERIAELKEKIKQHKERIYEIGVKITPTQLRKLIEDLTKGI